MTVLETLTTCRSGKLGSDVHSHNAAGPYIRPYVVPFDPNTQRQRRRRTRFTALSRQWRDTLTIAQRSRWETYAANVQVSNRIGALINLCGHAMFVRCNMPRPQPVAFSIRDAPIIFNHGRFTLPIINKTIIPEEDRVRFAETDAWVTEDTAVLIVQTSDTFPETINFFAKPWRRSGVIIGDAANPPTSPTNIVDAWPPAPIAHKWARVRVSRADGRLSPAYIVLFAPGFA